MGLDALAEGLPALAARLVDPARPGAARGAVLRVGVPDGPAVAAAAGVARADTGEPMTVGHRFHVASVGKLVTATLVLQLAERGDLGPSGVDVTLGELDALPDALVADLVRLDGRPMGAALTVRQLLTHTSGMLDVHVDDATGTALDHGGYAPGSLVAAFVTSTLAIAGGRADDGAARRRWRPAELVERYLAGGLGDHPAGAPGTTFHYSDTAYVVLALVVEALTGRSYAQVQRERVLEPLGLADTYLAYHDDPTPDARAHEMDMWLAGVPLLSAGLDVSFDYGGGGQVSTVADLAGLLDGLLGGRLFSSPDTLRAMRRTVEPAGLRPPFAALGLGLHRFVTPGGAEIVGHAGAWGVRLFRHEPTGTTIAGTVGQRDDGAWLDDAIDLAR